MMLTAMQHMDSSAYASPSSTSPWQQRLPLERSHLPSYEDLASAPAATHQLQHRAARRIAKRRPRPSRRLPTTYISADPAEFRRMVHQVTGADDLLLPSPQQQTEEPFLPTLAGRPVAPSAGGALLLPTLDTSAFLLGGCRARPAAAATRTDALPPLPLCDGDSLALNNTSGSSNCGFPTLESWDLL